MTTNVQVYPNPDDTQWGVRVVGDDETEPQLFSSREEAEEVARRLAEERGGRLVLHDEAGMTEKKEDAG
ncbi:MAG TPA: DUF2188 domain-containing protein [Actinomycetota bacterium]|nr:DUF2188 domain-containing protein [Actinomycetota bacterium]